MSNNPALPAQQVRAAQVIVGWSPGPAASSTQPMPKLAIFQGEMCWAFDIRGDWGRIEVRRDGDSQRGWIPKNLVQVGALYAHSIPVDIPTPGVTSSTPQPSGAIDNVLMRTLRTLWKTMKESKDTLVRAQDRDNTTINDLFRGPGADHYADIIYRCLDPRAIEIMKDGNFNPRSLVNSLPSIGPEHGGEQLRGIYLLFFGDITHNMAKLVNAQSPPKDALYGGLSTNLPTRKSNHFKRLDNVPHQGQEKSNLYKVGRSGPENMRKMVPFILFRVDDPDIVRYGLKTFIAAAELTTTCLFNSWQPVLLNRDAAATSTFSHVQHHENARSFSAMMAQVRQQTGWNPTLVLGLNWQTPGVTMSPHDREWVTWYDAERQAHIFTANRTVYLPPGGSGSALTVQWRLGADTAIPLSSKFKNASNLKAGDPVTLVVEIKHDGTNFLDHPVPWIRVPRPCRNKEFEKLKALSVQVQWRDKTTQHWKSCHVQFIQIRYTKGPPEAREFSQFVHGMQLFATLTQTTYRNPPGWLGPLDTTIIRKLTVDHLKQRATVDPVPLPGRICEWPVDNTSQGNLARMQASVPQELRNQVFFGARPGHIQWGPRKSCDLCLSSAETAACVIMANGQCEWCRDHHRLCSWVAPAPNRVLTTLLATGGVLQDLGMPTHFQAMNQKRPADVRRPDEIFYMDTTWEPVTVTIARQVLGDEVITVPETQEQDE